MTQITKYNLPRHICQLTQLHTDQFCCFVCICAQDIIATSFTYLTAYKSIDNLETYNSYLNLACKSKPFTKEDQDIVCLTYQRTPSNNTKSQQCDQIWRYGEILLLWQSIISLWQNCGPNLVNFISCWANIHCCKGPKIEIIMQPSGHTGSQYNLCQKSTLWSCLCISNIS